MAMALRCPHGPLCALALAPRPEHPSLPQRASMAHILSFSRSCFVLSCGGGSLFGKKGSVHCGRGGCSRELGYGVARARVAASGSLRKAESGGQKKKAAAARGSKRPALASIAAQAIQEIEEGQEVDAEEEEEDPEELVDAIAEVELDEEGETEFGCQAARSKPEALRFRSMATPWTPMSPLGVLHPRGNRHRSLTSKLHSHRIDSSSWIADLSAGKTTWLGCEGNAGMTGLWRWRRRRPKKPGLAMCAKDETSRSILQESGNKRRAARTAATVVQRVERAQEDMERRAMARKATKLYPRALLESLNERIRQNLWESALKVFELLRAQEWYDPEVGTYVKLLTMLGQCKKPELAAGLFDQMLEDKLRPTTAIFTALLTVYTKSGLFEKALEVFETMRSFPGCEPDVYTFTAMIKGCCDAGCFDRAARLLDEMRWEGLEPNTVTYNTLIFAYGKAGLFDEMERVIALMAARNVPPDTWTWNALIRVFGLHSRIAEMEHAYEGLLAQGLQPDVVTLNTLVTAYGRRELYGKMHCVLEYMRRYSYEMSAVTYNAVLEVYGKAGRIDQMELTFARMKAEGVRPNRVTFTSLLSAYGRHGLWHKIEKVMRQVRNYKVAPDAAVYNAAIDAYQRAQNFEDMERMFEEMKHEGCAPDSVTYAILIEAYKRIRRLDKAEQLQAEWEASSKK